MKRFKNMDSSDYDFLYSEIMDSRLRGTKGGSDMNYREGIAASEYLLAMTNVSKKGTRYCAPTVCNDSETRFAMTEIITL